MPDFGKVGSLSNFYLGAQTIQRGKLLFRFSSRCANYSRERSNQGGILFKEIRYALAHLGRTRAALEVDGLFSALLA